MVKDFLANILRAKRLLRQGWVDKISGRIESIAEHSFGVAAISLVIVNIENSYLEERMNEPIDKLKVLELALFHDLHETKTQDLDHSLDTVLGKTKANEIKSLIEEKSTNIIIQELKDLPLNFKEITQPKDKRISEIVLMADKLDLILQAKEYVNLGRITKELANEFINSAIKRIKIEVKEIHTLDKILEHILISK